MEDIKTIVKEMHSPTERLFVGDCDGKALSFWSLWTWNMFTGETSYENFLEWLKVIQWKKGDEEWHNNDWRRIVWGDNSVPLIIRTYISSDGKQGIVINAKPPRSKIRYGLIQHGSPFYQTSHNVKFYKYTECIIDQVAKEWDEELRQFYKEILI